MPKCFRCKREFDWLNEVREQQVDIYHKVKTINIHNKPTHKWEHVYLCPKCDAAMVAALCGENVKKL